ncbi:MAG: TonB-dependent receptor [Burkholderiaceae bacterium]
MLLHFRPSTLQPHAPGRLRAAVAVAAACACAAAQAHPHSPAAVQQGEEQLETVNVQGSRRSQLGVAPSANSGVVTQQQIESRTAYRPGEVLEVVPGLVVTQHSGEGKANQFYLRGFNLDHGTDFRITIDGMLVNQRSHAHGQGWSDMNFLIPELVTRMDYHKGPFYADEGDFATAGAVAMTYANRLPRGIAAQTLGPNRYRRTLLADSPEFGDGRLLYALELVGNNGPYTNPERYRKNNAVLRYSEGNDANGFNISAMAYSARWNATDQIPLRAVQGGSLSRFDAVDATDGGRASRYSLSGAWQQRDAEGFTRVNAYLMRRSLQLFSNFTYFAADPVNGDQFSQPDERVSTGLKLAHGWNTQIGGRESDFTIGLQLEHDNIWNRLENTRARQVLSTVRSDHVLQSSVGLYAENITEWAPWLRSIAGLRADLYRFRVESDNPLNSGRKNDQILSPKFGLVFGPWNKTELYLNTGRGFHSNDARGVVQRVDPVTGDAVRAAVPLVRARSNELGVRTEFFPGLQSSLSLFQLRFDSELLFAGDAGTTDTGRPSRRTGIEWSNYWRINREFTLDADVSLSRGRFTDSDPAGNRIPGSVEAVGSVALAFDRIGPWYGALQLRHFGSRALIEDNSVRSTPTTTLNGRIGYRINRDVRVELEGFNLTNRRASAIEYYYGSRLPGEAATVDDIHFHPVEPRTFRVTLTVNFD